MILLKQSTVTTVKVGPFVDDTDAVTVEDGLTIANTDVKLSKNGGTLAAASATQGTGNAAYDDNGYYDIDLDATDTNTLGNLRIAINYLGALPVWEDFTVVTEAAYNELCGGASGWAVQTYTVTDGAAALEGVHVLVTTGIDGSGEVAQGYTNSSGVFTFVGQTGVTYYLWRTKAGYTFTDPDTEVGA